MDYFGNVWEKMEQIRKEPVFDSLMEQLRDCYNEVKGKPFPQLNFTLFNNFVTNGDRAEYENPYFMKRRRLTYAVILYLYEEKPEYLTEICNAIWNICAEVTWVLPAHLAEALPHDFGKHIDLFSAETGRALSETVTLLGDRLPARIVDLVRDRVQKNIFDVYENNHFWWETSTNNWAAVCGGSVGAAYLYLAPEKFEAVRERLFGALDYFLSGYGEDGCSTEGIGYWCYGFGYYVMFADLYGTYTGGKSERLSGEKIHNMALYGPKMILRNDVSVSFSDAQRRTVFGNVGLLCYLKDRFPDLAMPQTRFSVRGQQLKLSITLRNLLWTKPEYLTGKEKPEESVTFFADASWYIAKKGKYSFAAKGGRNNEEHNHNDIGSFILADDEGQILVDIGQMEYTRETFSDKRYTLMQNSSLGHSVPIYDGREQLAGKEYVGHVLKADEESFSLELQDAYGKNLPKITRSFRLNENGITLCDCFENKGNTTERFVSFLQPEISPDGVKIGKLLLKANATATVSTTEISNHIKNMETYYLIDFKPESDKFTLEMVL